MTFVQYCEECLCSCPSLLFRMRDRDSLRSQLGIKQQISGKNKCSLSSFLENEISYLHFLVIVLLEKFNPSNDITGGLKYSVSSFQFSLQSIVYFQ